jgi:predicted Abi (CAAX) family protease
MGRRGAFFVLYHNALLTAAGMLGVVCAIMQSTTILDVIALIMILAPINEAIIYKLYKIPRSVFWYSLYDMFILFYIFFLTSITVFTPDPYAVFYKPAFAAVITLLTMFFMLDIIEVLDLATRLHIVK